MPKVVKETPNEVVVDIRDDPDYDWIRLRRKLKREKTDGNEKTDRSEKARGKAKRF